MTSRRVLGTLLLAIALMLSACGGDDDEGGSSSESESGPVTLPPDPDNEAVTSPDICIESWNASSNRGSQADLEGAFSNGEFGSVVAGIENGICVVAYRVDGEPTAVTYIQAGKTFEETEGFPEDQFDSYRETIDAVDLQVEPKGKVSLVP